MNTKKRLLLLGFVGLTVLSLFGGCFHANVPAQATVTGTPAQTTSGQNTGTTRSTTPPPTVQTTTQITSQTTTTEAQGTTSTTPLETMPPITLGTTTTPTQSETTTWGTTTGATLPPVTLPSSGEPAVCNMLTGLPLADPESAGKRPVMIMINNLKRATPQHGLQDADMIFEVEAEVGITRLMAVYTDISKIGTIGSVRSTRPVMVNMALGLDAFLIHAGGSDQAYSDIKTLGLDNIDGRVLTMGAVFYQDADRMHTMGYEHSLMTNGTLLAKRIQTLANRDGKRTELETGYTTPFAFRETGCDLDGQAAQTITTKYNATYQPYFTYNGSTGLYERFQYGAKHIDNNTGDQLAFTNIIVLSVTSKQIDNEGRRQFDDVGSGTGYYASRGTAIPIRWSKAAVDAPLRLWTESGAELQLNPGKSFISYVNGMDKITLR